MGSSCSSSASTPFGRGRLQDIPVIYIPRVLDSEEEASVNALFTVLDVDGSEDMSDDELATLLCRFGRSLDRLCVMRVAAALRTGIAGTRGGGTKKASAATTAMPASKPITAEVLRHWWPSILHYVERVEEHLSVEAANNSKGHSDQHARNRWGRSLVDRPFDGMLQGVRDAGFGAACRGNVPEVIDRITSLCQAQGVRFVDSTFKSGSAALGGRFADVHGWARAADAVQRPHMYVNGTRATDVANRHWGRNLYAAGMTSLAERFDLLLGSVYPPHYSPAGIYAVRINRLGEWLWVVVDDYVPMTVDGLPAFLHSTREDELWPTIIDKAFAKIKGSYDKLHRSLSLLLDPLHLLCGARPGTYHVPADALMASKEKNRADGKGGRYTGSNEAAYARGRLMFTAIDACLCRGWLLTATPTVAENDTGLILEHGYSVLGCVEGDPEDPLDPPSTIQLVKVRNPWGREEWSGQWSDEDTDTWNRHPKLKQRCQQVACSSDGVFWMNVTDLAARFTALHVSAVGLDECEEQPSAHRRGKSPSPSPPRSFRRPSALLTAAPLIPATATRSLDDVVTLKSPTGAAAAANSRPLSANSAAPHGDGSALPRGFSWLSLDSCWREADLLLQHRRELEAQLPVVTSVTCRFEPLLLSTEDLADCKPQPTTAAAAASSSMVIPHTDGLMTHLNAPQFAFTVPEGEVLDIAVRGLREIQPFGGAVNASAPPNHITPMSLADSTRADADAPNPGPATSYPIITTVVEGGVFGEVVVIGPDGKEASTYNAHAAAAATQGGHRNSSGNNNNSSCGISGPSSSVCCVDEHADCDVPRVWIVRGEGRQAAVPATRVALEASGGTLQRALLKPGSYVLMTSATRQAQVPLRLTLRTAAPLSLKAVPVAEGVGAVSCAVGLIGPVLGHLPGSPVAQLALSRLPTLQVHPSLMGIKAVSLVLVLSPAAAATAADLQAAGAAGPLAVGTLKQAPTAPAHLRKEAFVAYAEESSATGTTTVAGGRDGESEGVDADGNSSGASVCAMHVGAGRDFLVIPHLAPSIPIPSSRPSHHSRTATNANNNHSASTASAAAATARKISHAAHDIAAALQAERLAKLPQHVRTSLEAATCALDGVLLAWSPLGAVTVEVVQ